MQDSWKTLNKLQAVAEVASYKGPAQILAAQAVPFTVESDVPLPERNNGPRVAPFTLSLLGLKRGQSIFLALADFIPPEKLEDRKACERLRGVITYHAKRAKQIQKGAGFTTRYAVKDRAAGFRVWRTA